MWKAKHSISTGLLALTVSLVPHTVAAQAPRPYLYRETWYDFFLKRINATGTDYGRLIEERRQALLDATTNQPQFWYSLSITVAFFLLALFCAKLIRDNRRILRVTEEIVKDVQTHDLHSRQAAKDAVDRYNQHIEECNRAFEMPEGAERRPGWGDTQTESFKAELQRVTAQLETTTQERNKLQEELRQKSVIVSDLSLRLDALSKKVNGTVRSNGTEGPGSPNGKENGAVVVDHINHLQEELYAERQKNRRLKGS